MHAYEVVRRKLQDDKNSSSLNFPLEVETTKVLGRGPSGTWKALVMKESFPCNESHPYILVNSSLVLSVLTIIL